MATDRGLRLTGGYLGLALLASMITLAVMLVLFTDPGPVTRIEVGIPLREACEADDTAGTGGNAAIGLCFTAEVTNIGDRAGSISCVLTDPEGAHATFRNGGITASSDAISPLKSVSVMIRLDLYDGVRAADVSPPGLECVPA